MPASSKIGFRKWLDLETKKQQFIEAAENDGFPDRVFAYLSAAFDAPVKRFEGKEWRNSIQSLQEAHKKNFVEIYIPIIKDAPKTGKEVEWGYSQRDWFYYSHILAKNYGWEIEYIASLGVNEAFGYIQEVLTDEQLEREFTHGLSEVAYKYDKASKKSSYVPMKRPYWMKPVMKEIKKVKIRRDLLPVGRIQNVHGLPEEFKSIATETTNPPRNP